MGIAIATSTATTKRREQQPHQEQQDIDSSCTDFNVYQRVQEYSRSPSIRGFYESPSGGASQSNNFLQSVDSRTKSRFNRRITQIINQN